MTSRDKSYSDNDKQNGKYRKFIEKSTVQFGCVDSSNEPWFLMLTNPIKITEFVLTLLLFGVVVYLITLPDPGLRQTTSIFVIGISIAFLFFDSIQIIAHFAGSDLPEYPMVFINFLGVIFYLAAGCALLYTAPVQTWGRLTSFMLCFMISVVHTIGFLIILLIWRHRFCSMKKCHPLSYGQSGQIFFKNDGGPFFPGNCSCAMENITAEIIEPYESKNYQVFQRPQYTERHHSVPELSLQKQTEIQAEVAHKSRTGSRPDDTTQSVKYSEDLDQTGNQTCDICQRPLPEIARALETTFGQADTSQFPLASSSPKYTHRSSSPRAISTPPHGSHISSPVRQSIQSSLQYTRGHRPGLHTYTTTIPNAIVVKPAPTPPPAPTVAITTTTTSPTPAPTQPTSRAGPCCEFCNCASTICGKVHKLQHNKSQEQVQQSQPSQVNQLHWACFTTAPGTETAIFDATGKQFGCDTGLNPSDKPTMGYNAAYNTRPQMMQAAELSTTVGSIPKSLSDGSSSSFHVQKNKRTQTKSQKKI
ncbi:uncharacterized protein LOC130663555 isoform X2 [Microplitis mediator]|uniref:uncharacterized protein LOC130663555 isoform X2 n=1 Tax=Microplitis mediator TaxID=375433 RepID=UPI00255433D1|nr:uncharacterized protein LOC130663555 isoform X2 [Microplitis mediator]